MTSKTNDIWYLYVLLIICVQCTFVLPAKVAILSKLVVSAVLILFVQRIKINIYVKWSLLLLVFCWFSLVFSGIDAPSFDAVKKISLSIIVGIAFAQMPIDKDNIEKIIYIFTLGGVLYCFFIVVLQGPVSLVHYGIARAYANGVIMNFTYVSIPTAIFLSWFVFNGSQNKIRYVLLWIFMYAMNLFSGRRKASIVPLITLLLFYILKSDKSLLLKKLVRVMVSVGMFCIFIYVALHNKRLYSLFGYRIDSLLRYFTGSENITEGSAKSLITRQNLINLGWAHIKNNPFTPLGVGNYFKINRAVTHAHNNYIELWTTAGVWTMICYYALHVRNICWLLKHREEAISQLFLVFTLVTLAMDWSTTTYWNVMYISAFSFITCYCIQKKPLAAWPSQEDGENCRPLAED